LKRKFNRFNKIGEIVNVSVEFDIEQVPKYYTPFNEDIYLAGSFNNWNPNDQRYKLTKIANDKYRIIVNLDIGFHQYKFTRGDFYIFKGNTYVKKFRKKHLIFFKGSWDNVETGPNGENIPDRTIQVNQIINQTAKIYILNWLDMKGRHTASGNVIFLDRRFPYPQFNRTKRIWIYLPPDYYSTNKNYSVIYFNIL